LNVIRVRSANPVLRHVAHPAAWARVEHQGRHRRYFAERRPRTI
jgi:hypothetical protein